VRGHGIPGLRFAAVSLNEVGDDKFRGDVALGKIDLGLLAVKVPLSK
jgi:hypothetical protein